MNKKEHILNRIRIALKRETNVKPETLPLYDYKYSEPQNDLIEKFISNLEKNGVFVRRVENAADITNFLQNLITSNNVETIAVSNATAIKHFGIDKWLAVSAPNIVNCKKVFRSNLQVPDATDETDSHFESFADEHYIRALSNAQIGITGADYGVADTGTLVLISGAEQHRLISLLPSIHVCLIDSQCLVVDQLELFRVIKYRYRPLDSLAYTITLIAGASQTADIEQTLVKGVHGPLQLHVLLY